MAKPKKDRRLVWTDPLPKLLKELERKKKERIEQEKRKEKNG
jgi:hypothetical protein